MGGPSYRAQVVVVRKTKLGESDLILTLLSRDGSQLQAVAKGARKPNNQFASRLDVFCTSEVLLAPGKSLDIVQEAQLIAPHLLLRTSIERTAAAAPAAELLWRATQRDLPVAHLFDASCTGFDALNDGPLELTPGCCAAMLLKTMAFIGFRPSLNTCVICGKTIDTEPTKHLWVSALEGGVVCSSCHTATEAIRHPASTVQWASYLLYSPFADIIRSDMGIGDAFSVLRLCQGLISAHMGCSLRSLDFLFTCGLF